MGQHSLEGVRQQGIQLIRILPDAYPQGGDGDDVGAETIIKIIPKDLFFLDLLEGAVGGGDNPTFKTAFFMTANG